MEQRYETIERKDLQGQMVYPNWRLDKNISWFNISQFFLGLIYGFITLEWLRRKERYMIWRFHIGKLWLPLRYADDYHEIKLITDNTENGK